MENEKVENKENTRGGKKNKRAADTRVRT